MDGGLPVWSGEEKGTEGLVNLLQQTRPVICNFYFPVQPRWKVKITCRIVRVTQLRTLKVFFQQLKNRRKASFRVMERSEHYHDEYNVCDTSAAREASCTSGDSSRRCLTRKSRDSSRRCLTRKIFFHTNFIEIGSENNSDCREKSSNCMEKSLNCTEKIGAMLSVDEKTFPVFPNKHRENLRFWYSKLYG